MILHILIDDKFSDYVIKQFSDEKLFSKFAFVTRSNQSVYFHFIDKTEVFDMSNSASMNDLLNECNRYESVVFHGLYYSWQEWLIDNINDNVKIAWMFWGGEIYGQNDLLETFLLPLSKKIFKIHRFIKPKNKKNFIISRKILQKVDYCLTSVEEEYNFAKKYLSNDFIWLWYTYYTIEEVLGSLINKRCNGKSIWIGNAATIENNFLDIFYRVKKIGVNDRDIIVPLSYGTPWVKNITVKTGNLLFGKKFNPLLTFLPREEYNSRMLDCSVMIQAHLRPHAHGNIITALWLGMRVYLYENSIEYKFFKRLGLKVFSIEKDLVSKNSNKYNPLPEEDANYNQALLLAYYGKKNITNKIVAMSEVLNQ